MLKNYSLEDNQQPSSDIYREGSETKQLTLVYSLAILIHSKGG